MPPGGSSKDSQTDLAAMLAEMDSRLQLLQQELESVAVPIARRGPEPRRAARRADADPLAALSAEHQAYDDVQVMTPEPPPAAPERPARPPRAQTRAPRPPRPPAPEPPPAAASIPADEARMAEEARTAAELLPASRPRTGRRVAAIGRNRPASPLVEETPRRVPPTVAAPPAAAPAPAAAAPAARSSASEAVVRQTIIEAEEEARRVVENARDRIAEIGARTRALLEHSLGAAPEAAGDAPAPAPRRRRRAGAPRAAPEQRTYLGAVTVEAGPFADVGQLDEFEDALASVPGVEDVYIRTFERYYAHFELTIGEPTSLMAELQARVPETLRLIETSDDNLRLEILRDDPDQTRA